MWLLLCLQRGLLQSARAYREVGLSILLEALGRLAVGARVRRRSASASPAPTSARSPRWPSTAVALGVAAAPPARAARARRAPAPAARAGARRGAADRRADARRRAAERRRDHGQARPHRRRRRRLRGDDGRRQGRRLDRRRARLLGAAGGHPPRRRAAATRAPCSAAGWRVIAALSACALTIFAVVPELLLRTAFGAEYESGADVLLTLGAAYALLAVSYLCVQFQLGLHHRRFRARARADGGASSRCCCSAPTTSILRPHRARRARGDRRACWPSARAPAGRGHRDAPRRRHVDLGRRWSGSRRTFVARRHLPSRR